MAASITSGPNVMTMNTVPTQRVTITTTTPDTSYPTGGYALTPAQLGLTAVGDAVCNIVGGTTNNGAVAATYNAATGKVQLWATGGTSPVTLAEVANTTNLSGVTIKVMALGW